MGLTQEHFRDPQLTMSGEYELGFYPREFYPLDNFAAFQVEWAGCLWPTSEHAYQASKFLDTEPDVAEAIARAASPHDAYMIAQIYKNRRPANWDEIKLGVMEDIVRAKVSQHYYVQKKLLQTGTMLLVEDSDKDSYWGWGPDRRGGE